ncbi:MAG: FeoB small GTPase domain-containing protein, partial [Candidatus Thorarchaeota archaeon]
MSCHLPKKDSKRKLHNVDNVINIALAGNPNVGKSVIFNQLTGLSQTIGNWPGKTVEKMEGYLDFLGFHFNIVDLPGIYSLSVYSIEEIVSREYLISEDVDIIINVVDSTNLERNLFFTFQLLELEVPMIIAMNQLDILRKRNIDIDFQQLEKIMQLPVLPVVAVHGTGVHQLLEKAIEMVQNRVSVANFSTKEPKNKKLASVRSFGKEIESKVQDLTAKIELLVINKNENHYPSRFLALKLLEDDKEIQKSLSTTNKFNGILDLALHYR